jgi:deoxyribonuclease V
VSDVWPESREQLIEAQLAIGRLDPPPWQPPDPLGAVAGCFITFEQQEAGPGSRGDRAWAAAVLLRDGRVVATALEAGTAGWPYEPGMLALRAGPLLEAAVRALPEAPELLLVNATGRDHPRRAGLALQLGYVLDLPTVGVTHRPLVARGDWPKGEERGAHSPLTLEPDGEPAAYWLRTVSGARPLAIHAGWRTTPDTAVRSVLALPAHFRTPEPLRRAREVARAARSSASRRRS